MLHGRSRWAGPFAVVGREDESTTRPEDAADLAQGDPSVAVRNRVDPVDAEDSQVEGRIGEVEMAGVADPDVGVREAFAGGRDELGNEVDTDVARSGATQQRDGATTADADVEHVAANVFFGDALEENAFRSIDPALSGRETGDLADMSPDLPIGALRSASRVRSTGGPSLPSSSLRVIRIAPQSGSDASATRDAFLREREIHRRANGLTTITPE